MSAAHRCAFLLMSVLVLAAPAARCSDLDEFKVKRQAVFSFTQKPKVVRRGDTATITFSSKACCDVTVAVEDARRRIVRHLACGVLGENAPKPFQKGELKQTLVWDGKDDQGRYIDDKDALTVRVSLGLKARLERPLLWSPRKRISKYTTIMRAAPEGVYVYEAEGVDYLRLFDHQGNYVRTVHPFPSGKLKEIDGLKWVDFPQGRRLPFKHGSYQQTLLTSGGTNRQHGLAGRAAVGMAVHPASGRIALVNYFLNRLTTGGSTPRGLPMLGPKTNFTFRAHGTNADHKIWPVGPTSAAFSPDAKTLYLTGYIWRHTWSFDAHHGVVKLPFEGDGKVELFAGTMAQDRAGKGNGEFNGATSVAVDRKGRVYVSDFMNDRVQVFAPDGKHLKNIAVFKPAQVEIHPKTQELWVFTWPVYTRNLAKSKKRIPIRATLTRLGPFEAPRRLAAWPLPLPPYKGRHSPWWNLPPLGYRGGLDGWTDPPTIWLVAGTQSGRRPASWDAFNIHLLRPKGDKLVVVRAFGKDVARARGRAKFPIWNVQYQQLHVNPVNGHVYFAEPDSSPANKACNELIEVDPETGRPSIVTLPFNAEDIAFDLNGLAYLRSTAVVVRYDPVTWREVPWDYGEQLDKVSCGGGGRAAPVIAGLRMPATSPVCFHQGGMAVSARGHLAVSCSLRRRAKPRAHVDYPLEHGVKYAPTIFPGRVLSSTSACVHVWDRHGKAIYKDAVPGMPQIDGLGIDRHDALYVMATPTRVLDGTRYFNTVTETLMKLRPKKGTPLEPTFISSSPRAVVKLSGGRRPSRPPDVANSALSTAWVNGAEWFYGGVGFAGFNGPGCACWRAQFALDYFARSFAPEMDQYGVAVLDTNGNLILRIGQYGNADDGLPFGKAWKNAAKRSSGSVPGEPPGQRSIGGDEVALFHAGYVATHTDRRVFICDIGNARVVSVKLGYHATERVALKDVRDAASGGE